METGLTINRDIHEGCIALSRSDISQYIQEESQAEKGMTIMDAIESGSLSESRVAAYGRSEVAPSTVVSMQRSGILPMSRAKFRDRMRLIRGKSLYNAIKLNRLTLSDTKGYRVRMAYRLIRYLARIKGDLPGVAMLSTALDDRWKLPTVFHPREGYKVGVKGVRALLYSWANSNNTFTYCTSPGNYRTVKGTTYLPPPIPDKFYIDAGAQSYEDIWDMRVRNVIPQGYHPNDDEWLSYYCDVMEMLAEHLSVDNGTEAEPEAGVFGIAGLLTETTARIAWPTVDEMTMFEDEYCFTIYDTVISKAGLVLAEEEVQRMAGCSRMEAADLVRMAQEFGSNLYSENEEHIRTSLVNRLATLGEHTKEFDARATLACFKEMKQLLGLSKQVAGTDMEELENMVVRAVEELPGDEEVI